MMLVGMSVNAQQRNVLIIPDMSMQSGTVQQLPVAIENTDELVAVQFDITLPEGFTAEAVGTGTERCDGHVVSIKSMGDRLYRVLLYSMTNRPLRGQSGTVFTLPVTASSSLAEGSEHQPTIAKAVLTAATGENVLTGVQTGKIRISKLPDLVPKNLVASQLTLSPGDHLTVQWQVDNIGDLPTGEGWNERIELVSDDETIVTTLATIHYEDVLASGTTVSRMAEVILPVVPAIDGDTHLRLTIVPTSATGEPVSSRGNNTVAGSATIHVNKVLTLTLAQSVANEGSDTQIQATLTRSGRRVEAETFTIGHTVDTRLQTPETVVIEAGQSSATFTVTIVDDDVLQAADTVSLTLSASGNEYPEVEVPLQLVDDEQPALSVSASPSEITEGQSLTLTITTTRASSHPIVVTLTSEDNQHFSFPQQVTIPANTTQTTATVTTTDDELPGLDLSNAFTASASRHQQGQAIVILRDNDMPVLSLSLVPDQVSEGAGPLAVAATLRRTGVTGNKITVRLSDDAGGGIYYSSQDIIMEKNVEEVTFNLGPVDNALVDGDRTYNITAAVYISSCSCNAQGESAGSVTAQLKVLDNDGPALTLTSSVISVAEGSEFTLTVTRNSIGTEPLTVNIESDHDELMADYNHTLTIPAGAMSATLNLTYVQNDQTDDSYTVVFTANSEGYATGTCWLMFTDQTLPDAQITDISVSEQQVAAGDTVTVSLTISNNGLYELPAMAKINIYTSSQSSPVATIHLQEPLPVGQTVVMTKDIAMPKAVGLFDVFAAINENKAIKELIYTNNTSERVVVDVVSPFSYSLHVDKSTYLPGETVIVTGSIESGKNKAHQPVDVYVINENYRHVITVETDEQGNFQTTYEPFGGQMGHFVIGACYPNEGLIEQIEAFDFYGLRRKSSSAITCMAKMGETYSGSFEVVNPGVLPLSGIVASVVSSPSNCQTNISAPSAVAAGETFTVNFQIDATAITESDDWQLIELRIDTEEGVHLSTTLYYYCQYAEGKLEASVNNINTTVTKGTSREYSFTVTNIGKGETGTIHVNLPTWMKQASTTTLNSLSANESATVVLRLKADDDMQLNVPRTGTIGLDCTNGDGLSIPYSIEAVSEESGWLKVDACDEYTYNTTEAPHVANAEVVVRHPYTNEVIVKGQTDSNGIFLTELPEGYYKLEVTANKHEDYSDYCYVNPGRTETIVVNISYQPITISWKMEETEIEDEYSIETVMTYETNVPMPVVKIQIPQSIDGDNMAVGDAVIIPMVLTNIGLINAESTEVVLPTNMTEWKFEALSHTEPFTIAPQQSVLIPVRITRIADVSQQVNSRAFRASSTLPNVFGDCMAGMGERYKYLCGKDLKTNEAAERLALKTCAFAATGAAILEMLSDLFKFTPTIVQTKPGPTNKGNKGKNDGTTDPKKKIDNATTTTLDICDPCDAARAERIIDTLLGFTYLDLINGGINRAIEDYQRNRGNAGSLHFVVREIGGDIIEEGGAEIIDHFVKNGSTIAGYAIDVYEMATVCNDINTSRRKAPKKASNRSWIEEFDNAAANYVTQLQAIDQILLYTYGDRIWYDELDEGKMTFLNYISSLPDNYIPTDEELLEHKPESATLAQVRAYVNHVNGQGENFPTQEQLEAVFEIFEQQNEQAKAKGYTSMTDWFVHAYDSYQAHFNEMKSSSVCASITLKLSQYMAMTRQAFRGTLSVFNGHDTDAMENVRLNLEVKNMNTGEIATSHQFQINTESLSGFMGEPDLTSGWSLQAQATGDVSILFIPTKYAAPEVAQDYRFKGALTYVDPFTGLEVTRDLYPVTLTVKPTAELELDYFMQRDVYGDDPLTEGAVEPMEPAEFALIINNKGYGDAANLRFQTRQPEIIDNEKGLLIDFEIVSSQMNGEAANLAFGQTIANDFGTIPAHSQAYAQWWLQSSLLGHFTSYDVTVNHLTSYGNEDLSLVDRASIHELIHGFTVRTDGEKPVRGFLVNELIDEQDMPDTLFFTDATQQGLSLATSATLAKQSPTEYTLTVTPVKAGWHYGMLTDPTNGRQRLMAIVRQSDMASIPVDNMWQTDRTLLDGRDWLYENRLHFVANMGTANETFLLTFEDRPIEELAVDTILGVPEEGLIAEEPVTELTVRFNKSIDESTFSADDITLRCQGRAVDVSGIGITRLNALDYLLDLTSVTQANGYYVLTVQTSEITDEDGYTGNVGRQASWVQFDNRVITLDENATSVDYEDGLVNVLLRRVLKVNSWNTLCLPFAMSREEVETTWGEGSLVASLEEVEYESEAFASLRFRIHRYGIEANKPCLLMPTQNVPEVTIPYRDVEWQVQPEHALINFTFKGVYVSGQTVPVGDYYLSNDVIYRSQGLSTMKGYRGWFHDNLSGSSSRQFRLKFVDEDETTSIIEPVVESDGYFVYDLRGVKRPSSQRGLIIENHKKKLHK